MTATAAHAPIRQSFAATYDHCPKSAELSSRYDAASHAIGRGTVLHAFACRVVNECIAANERTYDPDKGRELMEAMIAESSEAIDAPEFDVLMGLAWKFCAEHVFDVENIVDVEEQYTAHVGGVTLTGRPDFVSICQGVAEVHDYKTAFAVDPESEIGGTFQGRFYAKLILDAYAHVDQVVLVWDYVRWGEPRTATVSRYELDGIDRYLTALVARVTRSRTEDDWPAVPGSWCSICPAPEECPLLRAERRDGAPTDVEMAGEYGKQILVTEALLKQRKEQLRAWCAEHGPLHVGDGDFGFTISADSDRVIDKLLLREAMEAVGLEWRAFFKTVKGSTAFKHRKAKSA